VLGEMAPAAAWRQEVLLTRLGAGMTLALTLGERTHAHVTCVARLPAWVACMCTTPLCSGKRSTHRVHTCQVMACAPNDCLPAAAVAAAVFCLFLNP
jgi:hypothetical protein